VQLGEVVLLGQEPWMSAEEPIRSVSLSNTRSVDKKIREVNIITALLVRARLFGAGGARSFSGKFPGIA